MNDTIKDLITKSTDFGIQILGGIVILIVGIKVVNIIIKILKKGRGFNKLDKSVQSFLISFLSISLKIVVLITVLGHIGVPMTSLITVFGSATLAVGLALQGGLTNMVGGLLILIFKPFKVGDWIETSSASGQVQEITIFYTVIHNLDNTRIVLPNGELANTCVKNFTHNGERKLCLDFSVAYDSDIDKVKSVLSSVIDEEDFVLKDKEIFVRLTNHADSALIFTVRVWTKNENYWPLKFNLLENVKKAFDKEKITIPFPQMDVHLDK
jgi:small conductance mechanosensitive channel